MAAVDLAVGATAMANLCLFCVHIIISLSSLLLTSGCVCVCVCGLLSQAECHLLVPRVPVLEMFGPVEPVLSAWLM